MKSKEQLIKTTVDVHRERYKCLPNCVSIAPGRINIIGEHTDYNYGLAMPSAISRYVCVSISKTNENKISAFSSALNDSFTSLDSDYNRKIWHRYISGCIDEVRTLSESICGLDITIHSSLDIGKGISSSAALEVSIVNGLSKIYGLNLSDEEIIRISRDVDHKHVGIKSGTLDFSASLLSKNGYILSLDFLNKTHSYTKSNLVDCSWVLVDSSIKRELVSSKYQERVDECNKAWAAINKEIKQHDIELHDITFLKEIDRILYRRIHHVITENARVVSMKKALLNNDCKKAGKLLFNSHFSLKNDYEVSCREIDFIVDESQSYDFCYGARIMGGGFGGNVISLIKSDKFDDYKKYLNDAYIRKYSTSLDIREVEFADGAEVLDINSVQY